MFEIGQNVIYIPNGQQATIVGSHDGWGGITYDISQNGTTYQNVDENDLQRCAMPNNPFEQMQQGYWGDNLDFCERNTTFKIKNSNSNTISTLLASRATFHAYQYKPLLKFFQSDNNRLLVADEVGLGKTIEAGHIMNELKARNRFGNVLIICPNALCEKWQTEMKEKFNLTFEGFGKDTDSLISHLKNHVGFARVILNYEKLHNTNVQEALKNFSRFQLVLCDEAHKLRNRTKNHRIVEEIFTLERAESMLFLTATPIMIGQNNLYNLLHLLDPEKYDNYYIFTNEQANNRPFIQALSKVANKQIPFQEIIQELSNATITLKSKVCDHYIEKNTTVDESYASVKLYQKIKSTLLNAKATDKVRSELQFDINSLSRLNHIFSRTRRRDVNTNLNMPQRQPYTIRVELSKEERRVYDKVIDNYERVNDSPLGLISTKRMVSSSIYGYLAHQKQRPNYAQYYNRPDAKFERLLTIAQQCDKVILFAVFRDTLEYLNGRLAQNGIRAEIIHGEVPANERNERIENFRDNDEIKVLLASEVGSEGIDLQFCSTVVNYDLPWNPMVVEQRIGRVDRIGQKAQRINIYNFVIANSVTETIYERLLLRIKIFQENIGDLEAILGEGEQLGQKISNLERTLCEQQLSQDEIRTRIDQVALAIENNKRQLEILGENSELLLTNDVYFSEEIQRIKSNHRYVTEHELKKYVERILNINNPQYKLSALGGLQEIDSKKMKFSIRFPNGTGRLRNFISDFVPSTNELGVLRDQYNNYLRDKNQIIFTFSQAEAAENTHKRNSQWEYINVYHPLIVAAQNYFEQHNPQGIKKAFKIELAENREKNITRGEYILAVYTTKFTKHLSNNQTQSNEILTPIVFDMQQNAILNSEQSEQFLGEAQLSATKNHFFTEISHELLQRLPFYFSSEIREQNNAYFEEHKMRLESEVELLVKRKTEFYDQRIATQEQVVIKSEQNLAELERKQENGEKNYEYDNKNLDEIKNQRSILPTQRGKLEALRAEKEREIARIRDIRFTHDPANILSVTHITVN